MVSLHQCTLTSTTGQCHYGFITLAYITQYNRTYLYGFIISAYIRQYNIYKSLPQCTLDNMYVFIFFNTHNCITIQHHCLYVTYYKLIVSLRFHNLSVHRPINQDCLCAFIITVYIRQYMTVSL